MRRGRRSGRPRLVAHVLLPASRVEPKTDADQAPAKATTSPTREHTATRVGFVVSKAVGNAVLRHRVTRKLRHLMRARLPLLPAGTLVVIRALPPAADASSHELGTDLDVALRRLRALTDSSAAQ